MQIEIVHYPAVFSCFMSLLALSCLISMCAIFRTCILSLSVIFCLTLQTSVSLMHIHILSLCNVHCTCICYLSLLYSVLLCCIMSLSAVSILLPSVSLSFQLYPSSLTYFLSLSLPTVSCLYQDSLFLLAVSGLCQSFVPLAAQS